MQAPHLYEDDLVTSKYLDVPGRGYGKQQQQQAHAQQQPMHPFQQQQQNPMDVYVPPAGHFIVPAAVDGGPMGPDMNQSATLRPAAMAQQPFQVGPGAGVPVQYQVPIQFPNMGQQQYPMMQPMMYTVYPMVPQGQAEPEQEEEEEEEKPKPRKVGFWCLQHIIIITTTSPLSAAAATSSITITTTRSSCSGSSRAIHHCQQSSTHALHSDCTHVNISSQPPD